MATTEISSIDNQTSVPVIYYNTEHSQELTVDPGRAVRINHNVPWATSKDEFRTHQIILSNLPSSNPVYIWQHNDGGEDAVRYSTDGEFRSTDVGGMQAPKVPGSSEVGGRKTIVISNDGFTFTRKIVPGGPPRWG